MTNDQIWHQSTVMERCEILRSRLDSLDTGPGIKLGRLDSVQFAPSDYVNAEMVERWKRIEAAAKRVCDEDWTGFDDDQRTVISVLRAECGW